MIKKNAFTFVELLVVMTIIGIVFAMTTVTYSNVTKSSRDARRKADMESIRQALELCRSYSGSYPTLSGFVSPLTCGTQTYMATIPVDPKTDANYTYAPVCAGTPSVCTSYTLSGTLETGAAYSVYSP